MLQGQRGGRPPWLRRYAQTSPGTEWFRQGKQLGRPQGTALGSGDELAPEVVRVVQNTVLKKMDILDMDFKKGELLNQMHSS